MEILIFLAALAVGLYFFFRKNNQAKQQNDWVIPKNFKGAPQKHPSNVKHKKPEAGYSQLVTKLLGSQQHAERLIAYELKRGAKSRQHAIDAALDRLLYDKSR